MNATKINFDIVNGILTEQKYGSIPALTWVDTFGNKYRAMCINLPFNNYNESYPAFIKKQIQPSGTTLWLDVEQYSITAEGNQFRDLSTGAIILNPDGSICADPTLLTPPLTSALDSTGAVINPTGFVTNGKFFTLMIGYNISNQPLSVFNFVYTEIAEKENLTITG